MARVLCLTRASPDEECLVLCGVFAASDAEGTRRTTEAALPEEEVAGVCEGALAEAAGLLAEGLAPRRRPGLTEASHLPRAASCLFLRRGERQRRPVVVAGQRGTFSQNRPVSRDGRLCRGPGERIGDTLRGPLEERGRPLLTQKDL